MSNDNDSRGYDDDDLGQVTLSPGDSFDLESLTLFFFFFKFDSCQV